MRASALLAFMLVAPAAFAQEPPASPPKGCTPHAEKTAGAVTPRQSNLSELPDAVEIRTVWRMVDGCPKPVVLRDGVGNNPDAPRPPVDGEVARYPSQ